MKDFPFFLDPMNYFFIFYSIGPIDLLHSSPAPHFKTFQMFLICAVGVQVWAPSKALLQMYYCLVSSLNLSQFCCISPYTLSLGVLFCPWGVGYKRLQNISTYLISYVSSNVSNCTLNSWSNSITRRSVRSVSNVMFDNDMDFVLL